MTRNKRVKSTVLVYLIYRPKWGQKPDILCEIWEEPEMMFTKSKCPKNTKHNKSHNCQSNYKDEESSSSDTQVIDSFPVTWSQLTSEQVISTWCMEVSKGFIFCIFTSTFALSQASTERKHFKSLHLQITVLLLPYRRWPQWEQTNCNSSKYQQSAEEPIIHRYRIIDPHVGI